MFRIRVNGAEHVVDEDSSNSLLFFLRDGLGLKGAKFGCGLGQCGACVVLMDGRPAAACQTPMWATDGREVRTVEDLSGPGGAHPVQRALEFEQAAQCGYCIGGIAMTAVALMHDHPVPGEREIRRALDRHLCRCGIHGRIVAAVRRAIASKAGRGSE